MIQAPTQALRARRFETLAITLLLAFAFFLPGSGVLAMERLVAHAESWLLAYQPVIYLQEGASPEEIQALEDELSRWPGVGSLTQRDQKEALSFLETSLGQERVAHLGISESMLPHSIVLTPSVPLQGHIELASKVAALEVRESVAAVDVPDKNALKLMGMARTLSLCGALMLLLFLGLCFVLARAFLRRIQHDERRELELLEIFGASRRSLTRPTLSRALMLSVWGASLATLMLCVAQLNLDRWTRALSGVDAMAPMTWFVVFSPMLVAPFFGFVLGQTAIGLPRWSARERSLPGLRSLLHFDRDAMRDAVPSA